MIDNTSHLTMNRRTVLKSSLAGGVAGLAGCLSSGGEAAAQFRVAAPWEVNRDPLDGGSMLRRLGITDAMVGVDYDASPAPELATSWESSDNGQEWEFSLREGVTFHDGDPLDAEAVVTSLRRVVDAPAFAEVPIEAVEAVDDHTVTVRTSTPFSPLPAHLSRHEAAILSPNAYENGDVTMPIGTGPFQLESWDGSSELHIVRNDDYYGTVPAVKSVQYETIEDDQTRERGTGDGADPPA